MPPKNETVRLLVLHESQDNAEQIVNSLKNSGIATRPELERAAAELFAVMQSGAVKIAVNQRFPLAEAKAAHDALEGRRTTGATVLLP